MDEEYFIGCGDTELYFKWHDDVYRTWLNENIGRGNWQFWGPASFKPFCIRFENKEDALAFKLKFGICVYK